MCIKKIEFKHYQVGCQKDNKLVLLNRIEVSGYYSEKLFPGDDRDWIPTYRNEKLVFILPDDFRKIHILENINSITYKDIKGVNYLIDIDAEFDFGLNIG